jgi:predicted dehydrogenase
MKQVLQNLSSGETVVEDVPVPGPRPGHLLIQTRLTLVSAGTEKMLVDFGRGNLLQKARQQPEKARQVLDKVRTDGLVTTYEAVRRKLDEPLPLGYCNVGRVVAVGAGVTGFCVGDRVLSNGKHAGFVCVPKHLCAAIPEGLADEDAVFAVMGAIALQGMRLAAPTLGESFVVVGLGLVGLMAVQLLRANGCRVMGVDLDPSRLALAKKLGATEVVSAAGDVLAVASEFCHGQGIDGVLITATTSSSVPVSQAARMCRKRGRIVLVGVVGLELNRADFYEKELSFQVSCSYGPGRHDPGYETRGDDYPAGFVRWTEQRNFVAVLDAMAGGALNVASLRTHRFAVAEAERAYEVLAQGQGMGILLEFSADPCGAQEREPLDTAALQTLDVGSPPSRETASSGTSSVPRIAFLGSGSYATGILMPAFAKTPAALATVTSADGLSAANAARKFGFATAATDNDAVLRDGGIDAVVICTRHDSHADLVCRALSAGKHVFVEKPLALDRPGLDKVRSAYEQVAENGRAPHLLVGFNRRFAPLCVKMRKLLATTAGPRSMVMTVNAGAIPADHWTQDRHQGGGRIIGEACHFIDLLRYFAAAPIIEVHASGFGTGAVSCADTVSVTLTFADGSVGTVHYFANGHRRIPKERLEIFAAGRVLRLDNFKRLQGWGWHGFNAVRMLRQDKGQTACAAAFVDLLAGRAAAEAVPSPEELFEVTAATIDAADQLDRGDRCRRTE